MLNRLKAHLGVFAVARQAGVISPDYTVLRPRRSLEVRYFEHVLRSPTCRGELRVRAKGLVEGFWRLYTDDFYDIRLPVPPIDEQRAIVRFLDHADHRIRKSIRAKTKLIALLNEQKDAIVHHAVVRGFDPNAAFDSSAPDSRGSIPPGWELMPIKRAFALMEYGISDRTTDEGHIRVLTMAHIKYGRVSVPAFGGVTSVSDDLLLQPGDLLFNRTNSPALVGKVGLFEGANGPVTFASYLVRMRPRPEHDPAYLNMVLNDSSILSAARREAIPSLHQANLNPTRYGRLRIALPSRDEQRAILAEVTNATLSLTSALAVTERELALLREYRTRLIADVVTGKLDVRELSARLPDARDDDPPEDALANGDDERDDGADVATPDDKR